MSATVERGRPTFTPEQARLIRERAYAGERPTDLAAEYGVSVPLLSNLLHGHTYQLPGGGPRKDTAIVLPGKALRVEFDADNPGRWLTHCHNVYHGEAGMMTAIAYQTS